MEEKILIKSQKYDVKKLFKAFVIIGLVLTVIFAIGHAVTTINSTIDYCNKHKVEWFCITNENLEAFEEKYDYDPFYNFNYYINEVEAGEWEIEYDCDYCLASNGFSVAVKRYFGRFFSGYIWMYLIPVVTLSAIGGLIYLWLNSYNLTVSNKRVSGEVIFGKKADLPIDSVSAISVISIFKGVGISTSSGKISFLAIKNYNEMYEIINDLLIERQKEKEKPTIQTVEVKSDEADQLKKYKDLYDSGVITQEEFDQKKKQLLGL